MSFRDLVNGKESDLVPPRDVYPATQTTGGIVAAAVTSVVSVAAAALYPQGAMHALGRGASSAFGSISEGRRLSEEAAARNEENRKTRIKLGLKYLERIEMRSGATPELLCKKAAALFALQSTKHALKEALRAVELDASNSGALKWAGFLYLNLSMFSDAIEMLVRARSADPSAYEVAQYLATAHTKLGNAEETRKYWLIASELDEQNGLPYLRLAQLYEQERNYAESKHYYERASKLYDSLDLPWLISIANANEAFVAGHFDEAERLANEAIGWDRDWAEPVFVKAQCAISRNDLLKALNLLDEVLRIGGDNLKTLLLAAEISDKLGNGLANQYWMRAFALDSTAPVPWVIEMDLAHKACNLRDFELAIEHLDRANALYGTWDEAHALKQKVLGQMRAKSLAVDASQKLKSDDFPGAEALWKASLALDDVAEVHLRIGAEYADRGATGSAMVHFERAVSLGHPLAQKALALCSSYHDLNPAIGPSQIV